MHCRKTCTSDGAYPGGLVREQGSHLEAIGSPTRFFYLFLLLGRCIKAYKKQVKNTLNNIFIIFYCLLSYKIDKYGGFIAEPI
jgi:hypothetical protein